MRILFFIISILMLLLTVLRLSTSTGNFLFARGSDVLMSIVSANALICVTLLILFLLFLFAGFIYKRKRSLLLNVLPAFIFLLWLLSGRMIAIFPDGRLISGWFYIGTYKTDICKNAIDCDTLFYYDTKVEKLSFWRLKITNREACVTIFTGPFVWTNALKLFEKEFPGKSR